LIFRFSKLRLHPDSVHLQFLPPVDLEPPVHEELLLLQPCRGEQCSHLLGGEEIATRPVTT